LYVPRKQGGKGLKRLEESLLTPWSRVLEKLTKGNWNVLKIVHTIPEQHTGRALNQAATENSRIGHCTHTAGGANVKVKGKAIPLQALTGPEGSRRMRLPDIKAIGTRR
jgi:hypothetical protein